MTRPRNLLTVFAVMLGLTHAGAVLAQDPAAAPAPAPAAAAAPAAPAPAPEAAPAPDGGKGFVAYINNTDPGAAGLPGSIGPGHNAWMMTSAALVLFMTLPGLALFYGGLVRKKNVLSVVAQCFGCAGAVTILWVCFGYSMVFADGDDLIKGVVGNMKFAFFEGVGSAPNTNYAYWVSHNVFAIFQMMFAIITPGLIVGAIAERMKFTAIMAFIVLWMIIVYFPLAHMVWGINGYMNGVWNAGATIKAIDFAGGTVVHMSSGWSALLLCMLLGKRNGYGKTPMPPHSMVLCAIGTGMLWVGWYGFNAGSAVAADGIAASAFTTTTIAAAVASFVWPLLEKIVRGKASILGFCSGAVAGLVVITPACGFVTVKSALIIGVLAAVVPFFFCTVVKQKLGYDDALDTFGVHAVGGTLGALLTGFMANIDVNANLAMNLKDIVGKTLWLEQLYAMGITIALSLVATFIITKVVQLTIGLRPTAEEEDTGLDLTDHGEAGYEYNH